MAWIASSPTLDYDFTNLMWITFKLISDKKLKQVFLFCPSYKLDFKTLAAYITQ
jgi:hypothetical protein